MSSSCGVEFVDMTSKVLFFPHSPTLRELVVKIETALGWLGTAVGLQGRYDAGGCRSYTQMIPIRDNEGWELYKELIENSQIKSIVVVAVKVDINSRTVVLPDLNKHPTVVKENNDDRSEHDSGPSQPPLWEKESVDHQVKVELLREQKLKGAARPATRVVSSSMPSREEIIEEKPNVAHLEAVNDEFVGVSPIDIPAPPFVPQVASSELDGDPYTFEDHNPEDEGYDQAYAADSDEDREEPQWSVDETDAFVKVWGRHPSIHEFKDVREAHLAVSDSNLREYGPQRPEPIIQDGEGPIRRPRARPLIYAGLKFKGLLEMQIWLQEYAVRHHRQYIVFKSNQKERYVVMCDDKKCGWKVRARKTPQGRWKISSYDGPHTCGDKVLANKAPGEKVVRRTHRQLTSTFIAHRCAEAIKATPTLSAASLMKFIHLIFEYRVTYGKAWRAKQMAMKMAYGDWEEAYGRLPKMLAAMAYRNPGMTNVVQPHPTYTRTVEDVKYPVSGRAFWCFRPCVEAFKHCRPFLSVDGTFLTGKFKGSLLVAISCDADNRLVPLAFALVTGEDTNNWSWFMHLLRTKVVGRDRVVCLISDRHQGILNAVKEEIVGHPLLKHR